LNEHKLIDFIKNSSLLRVSAKNSIQVVVRFIVGFINIKVVALFVGPSGMAIISQLQNFLQLGQNISSLGFNNGIIKNSANINERHHSSQIIISTAFIATVLTSTLLGLITAIFSKSLSILLFKSIQYQLLLCFSGVYFIIISIINFYLSYLNGTQKLKRYIQINIILSTSGFVISFIALYYWGQKGLMWAQLFNGALTAILLLPSLLRVTLTKPLHFSFAAIKRLGKFSIMALVGGILSPVCLFSIRKIIALNLSWDAAGIWDGINKISTHYIMLITMSFSYYFLPTFSKIRDHRKLKTEVYKSVITLLPILTIGGMGIYLCRNIIIRLLFSEEFYIMNTLFIWQVIGDFFKILSWIIGYLFLAKEMVKLFLITEFTSVLLQVVLAYVFTLQELPINLYYAVENILYFVIMFTLFHICFKPLLPHH